MPTQRWARKGRHLLPRQHICQEMNLNLPFSPVYISCGLLNHRHIADSQAPLPQLPQASSSTAPFRDVHTTAIATIPTTSRPTMSARASLLISRMMSPSPPEVVARDLDLTDGLAGFMNRHHYLTLLLDNKLFLAPVKPDAEKVLDIGTGTGMFFRLPGSHCLVSHLNERAWVTDDRLSQASGPCRPKRHRLQGRHEFIADSFPATSPTSFPTAKSSAPTSRPCSPSGCRPTSASR